MPTPEQRGLRKKKRKTIKKTKEVYSRDDHRQSTCANCKKKLAGTPGKNNPGKISKLSKTEKRPSVKFGGVLCSGCRRRVWEEAVNIQTKQKTENTIDLKLKNYVKGIVNKIKI